MADDMNDEIRETKPMAMDDNSGDSAYSSANSSRCESISSTASSFSSTRNSGSSNYHSAADSLSDRRSSNDEIRETVPMAMDDNSGDSAYSSANSSRHESISSTASSFSSTRSSGSSNYHSAADSLSDRRSSTSSNTSGISTGSNFSSRSSLLSHNGVSTDGYPSSATSSRRSSLSSVRSDDSTTTLTSQKSGLTFTGSRTAVGGNVSPMSTKAGRSSLGIPNTGSGHLTGRYQPPVQQPIRPSPPAQIEVFVVDFNDKNHTIRIRLTDTVKSLKQKIFDKLKLHLSQQSLKFQGKLLINDHQSLESYGIQNYSNIYLTGRLRGGCPLQEEDV